MPHYNYKKCKVCLTVNGVCLTECKSCGNDKFWPIPQDKKQSPVYQEFRMARN